MRKQVKSLVFKLSTLLLSQRSWLSYCKNMAAFGSKGDYSTYCSELRDVYLSEDPSPHIHLLNDTRHSATRTMGDGS